MTVVSTPDPRPAGEEEFYTTAEFARIFGVHVNSVRRWARTGVIRSVRVGGVVRIPASELPRTKQAS